VEFFCFKNHRKVRLRIDDTNILFEMIIVVYFAPLVPTILMYEITDRTHQDTIDLFMIVYFQVTVHL